MTTDNGKGPNKFETHSLLLKRETKQWTPIPRFFFRLWLEFSTPPEGLPPSFWTTLFFVLNATIGASEEGISGTLSQSQIPADRHESGKWIAALDGYGLIGVVYADYRKPIPSKFTFNADRTESDWLNFVLLLCQGFRQGEFTRERSAEDIKEIFACLKNLPEAAKPLVAKTPDPPRVSQAWLDALPNWDHVLSRPPKKEEE